MRDRATRMGRPPKVMDKARVDAIDACEVHYVPSDGKPCPHGHDPLRYVSTNGCVECCHEASRRSWRAKRKKAA